MGLLDCLEKIQFEQDIADYMLERSEDLQDQGIDQLTAERQVIAEMFDDIESTLNQISAQLMINRDGSPKRHDAEFAIDALIPSVPATAAKENDPRNLFNFKKGDLVKNTITNKEYEVIEAPKGKAVNARLKEKDSKQIVNFNAKRVQWIPVQKEVTIKQPKGKAQISPDSKKGKLLKQSPKSFKEAILQFFIGGGKVSHADFVRYNGFSPIKEGYVWAIKGKADGTGEQGRRYDSFWEDMPEEWGRNGGMDDINEIVSILNNYPGITQMMTELEKLQSDEQMPQNMIPPYEDDEFINDDLDAFDDEVDDVVKDIMDNPEVKAIVEKYTSDGILDVDKLLDLMESAPREFTIFPFALKQSELIEFKKRLQDEQRNRKTAGQESSQRDNPAPVQDTKENTDGSDTGNEAGAQPEEERSLLRQSQVQGETEQREPETPQRNGGETPQSSQGAEPVQVEPITTEANNSQPQNPNRPDYKTPKGQAELLKYLIDAEDNFANNKMEIAKLKGTEGLSPVKRKELKQRELIQEQNQKRLDDLQSKVDDNILSKEKQTEIRKLIKQTNTLNAAIAARIIRLQDERDAKEKSLQKRNEVFGDRKAEEEKQSGMTPMFAGDFFNPSSDLLKAALKPFNDGIQKAEEEIDRNNQLLDEAIDLVLNDAQPKIDWDTPPAEPDESAEAPESEAPQNPLDLKIVEVSKPSAKIEDFGEHISGAKKEIRGQLRKQLDTTDDDLLNNSISKVLPVVDYKQIVDSGTATAEEAAFLAWLRLGIGPKPKSPYKQKSWLRTVNAYKDALGWIIEQDKFKEANGGLSLMEMIEKSADVYMVTRMKDYISTLVALGFPNDVTGLGGYEIKHFTSGTYMNSKGEKTEKPDRYTIIKGHYIIQDFSTREEAIAGLKYILTTESEKPNAVKFDMWREGKEKGIFVGKKIAAGKYIVLAKGFDKVSEARKYIENHQEELEKMLDEKKVIPYERPESRGPRIGKDYRGGKDVTPEMFSEAFGFRGVQFGNYVEKLRRQEDLNEAYDALMDLSEILNIPPRAVSLGGQLGIAFGARGTGGKRAASAHYEPVEIVINLTKGNGPGSLAHEWFHAVDNYFSRSRGGKLGYMTDRPIQLINRDGSMDNLVRKEVIDAWKNLANTIHASGLRLRSQNLDKKRSKDYWSQPIEMAARSFESYIRDKLSENNTKNDYLVAFSDIVNYIVKSGGDEGAYPYPTKEEAEKINAAFDGLFKTIQVKTEGGQSVMYRVIGERGASAIDGLLDNLDIARKMEDGGKSPNEIFLATGWQRGADKLWRYETRDIEFKKGVDFVGTLKPQNEAFTEEVPITDIVDDEELFNSYPQLKDVKLTFYNYGSYPELAKTGAFSNFDQKIIALGTEDMAQVRKGLPSILPRNRRNETNNEAVDLFIYDTDSFRSVLSHEIQHYIQRIEGFGEGGTLGLGGSIGKGNPKYKYLTGEVEARNVQRRISLPTGVRRTKMLSETEDVARDQQEVIRGSYNKQENSATADIDRLLGEIETDQLSGSDQALKNKILKLGSELHTSVVVIKSKNDLPARIQKDAKKQGVWNSRITGLWDTPTKSVYIVLDGIKELGPNKAIEEATKTILHEAVAHQGLPKMLGEAAYNKLLEHIYDDIPEDEKRLLEYDYSTKDRRTIASEYLASVAEENVDPNIFQRIIAKIREFLRKMFNVSFNENDIREILRRSKENLRKPTPKLEFAGDYIDIIRRSNFRTDIKSPAFKRWFGDSKVVDKNGNPLVVYHGTQGDFDKFSMEYYGSSMDWGTAGKGYYFTNDNENASNIATNISANKGKTPGLQNESVMPVYLSIQNPYYGDPLKLSGDNKKESEKLTEKLKAKGYDGFIGDPIRGITWYIAFSPNQIKSATGNNGYFDPYNPDIRFRAKQAAQNAQTPLTRGSILSNADERYNIPTDKRTRKEKIEELRRGFKDMNLPIRRFEEAIKKLGGTQNDKSKPYRDINLAFERLDYLVSQFTKNKFDPIKKAVADIRKTGVPAGEVLPYVISKRATELNPKKRSEETEKWIASRRERDEKQRKEYLKLHPKATAESLTKFELKLMQETEEATNKFIESVKNKDYSGVMPFDNDDKGKPRGNYTNPDILAADIVNEFEGKVDKKLIDNLWSAIKESTSEIVNIWERGNQISQEDKAEYMKSQYYVPLRGWRFGAAKELVYTKGEGFSKSLKHAEGRVSLADNPLAYIEKVAFQAITEQVDNEVRTSMANLVIQNLNVPGIFELVTVKKLYYVKQPDGTTMYTIDRPPEDMFENKLAETKTYTEHENLRPHSAALEHEVSIVRKPGGDLALVFKGDNVKVSQALNRQNFMFQLLNDKVIDTRTKGKLLSLMSRATNIMKANLTQWNVVFPFTNHLRDSQEGPITQYIKHGGKGLKTYGKYPSAYGALFRYIFTKPDITKLQDRDAVDFYENGGATGWTHGRDIEQIEKDIERDVNGMVHRGIIDKTLVRPVKTLLNGISFWNQFFEDASRFSVYRAALAMGMTKKDAAYEAKEATINMNRKGILSKQLDAWVAFFNVALEGANKNISLAKNFPKRFSYVAVGYMALGYLNALLWNLFGDDDDEDAQYKNISPYMRQNYLTIPNPIAYATGNEKTKYISIPLAQFWRAFFAAGNISYDVMSGRMKAGEGFMNAAVDMVNALSPVDIGGFWVKGHFSIAPLVPTITRPVVEVMQNRDYLGNTVYKKPFTVALEGYYADAGLGKKNANPAAKMLTDFLYATVGQGDKETYLEYRTNKYGEDKKVLEILDWNPSKIEHIIKGYLGGTGAFVSDLITTIAQGVGEEDIDFKNIPFVNKFVRVIPEAKWAVADEYYANLDQFKVNDFNEKSAIKSADQTGDYDKLSRIEGNAYRNMFQEIMSVYSKEINTTYKDYDFDYEEGSKRAIDLMKMCNEEVSKLKDKYGKK